MTSLINSTSKTPADIVAPNQIRSSAAKKKTHAEKETSRTVSTPLTLPEDIVTLSSNNVGESTASPKKSPSVAVSNDERQALLGGDSSANHISVYV